MSMFLKKQKINIALEFPRIVLLSMPAHGGPRAQGGLYTPSLTKTGHSTGKKLSDTKHRAQKMY